ncbi:MAG: secondary thiamine-phosphate synthase enzyme YjbQ [Chloroflexota bacterium]|nr:secondary thiamine-phosphate synthase enzyme YjbQ [Chloroflexota bacterium]MDE2897852.1 secondary thiamine-phosphate synthase enzyme YjbQ [Chloroflexota bacterium]
MPLASLRVTTSSRTSVHPVGRQMQAAIEGKVRRDGLLLVSVPHTTCAVTLNEPESGLLDDFARALERLVPWDGPYAHNVGAEDNAAAHVRANLIGHQVLVPVVGGRLQVGVWQDVLLIECDGPRTRTVEARLLADGASG